MSHVDAELERFRRIVRDRLGLSFDETRLAWLSDVLRRRSEAAGTSAGAFVDRLDRNELRDELRALATDLTVGETFFFRNPDHFEVLASLALPERLRARGAQRVRLLSAGCSSGEEPYTLAMIAQERLPDPSRVEIVGVDVNPAALERARAARYSQWSLRATPDSQRDRWFRAEGRDFVVDRTIRSRVELREGNLFVDDPDLWRPGSWDVIFFRNVMMYFAPEVAAAIIARMTAALVPEGYLFLGHAETLRGVSNEFHLRHTHGTFYYQRRSANEPAVARPHAWRSGDTDVTSTPPPDDAGWVDHIRRATDRVRALTDSTPSVPSPVPEADLTRALELLEKERFSDALEMLRHLPQDDLDVRLLRAALLTHGGRFAEAEHACREVLAADELNEGAHYLLALCREGVGDREGAIEHEQVVAYLDPTFAMARLHLGLLARKAGNRETACRELGQALQLLQREAASRLLLFGGGFSRDALISLCRAELVAAGGRP